MFLNSTCVACGCCAGPAHGFDTRSRGCAINFVAGVTAVRGNRVLNENLAVSWTC